MPVTTVFLLANINSQSRHGSLMELRLRKDTESDQTKPSQTDQSFVGSPCDATPIQDLWQCQAIYRQQQDFQGLGRPLAFLRDQTCLPSARNLLDRHQTRYGIRALSVDCDDRTHQLLPADFRLDELYGYDETTVQPSSIGWTRLEKTHRLFGSRPAQQVIKHIKYDVEHGYDLPCRQDPSDSGPVTRMPEHYRLPVRMLPDHP